MTSSPYEPPQAELQQAPPPDSGRAYFTVGTSKLAVMSVLTLGLYPVWWFYRNWSLVKARDSSSIMPVLRAFFAPIWFFALSARVNRDAESAGLDVRVPTVILGIVFVVLNMLVGLPDPYWLLSFAAFLPVASLEIGMRQVIGGGEMAPAECAHYSPGNIAWAVGGGLLLALSFVGVFFIPPEGA